MSNLLSKAQRDARKAARIHWLKGTPALLARLPGADQNVSPDQHDALLAAYERMVDAGLYSRTNDKQATRWGIRLLVSEIREEALPDWGARRERYSS